MRFRANVVVTSAGARATKTLGELRDQKRRNRRALAPRAAVGRARWRTGFLLHRVRLAAQSCALIGLHRSALGTVRESRRSVANCWASWALQPSAPSIHVRLRNSA